MKKIALFHVVASLLLTTVSCVRVEAQTAKPIDVGDKIPSFSLTDQDGNVFNTSDCVGKKTLVLFFYPKGDDLICVKEASAFRDSFDDFTKAGAMIIGINGTSVASQKKFHDKYKLPFTLLSDPKDKVYRLFGIKNVVFSTGRKTFVVDKSGLITFSYDALLEAKEHADGALKFIQSQGAK